MIRNFRPAAGFLIDDENENKNENKTNNASTVYRCGSTDILGQQNKYNRKKINKEYSSSPSSYGDTDTDTAYDDTDAYDDQIVFHHAGLILDLRSPSERNEEDAHRWMVKASVDVSGTGVAALAVPSSATRSDSKRTTTTSTTKKPRHPLRSIHILKVPTTIDSIIEEEWFEMNFTTEEDDEDDKNNNNSLPSRYVIQLDILNRFELVQYIQTNWLSKTTVSINDHSDHSIANSMTAELNKRGLAGLNEAIVETKTGQTGLCRALQIITLYREAVIHSTKKRNRIKRNHDSTHQQQQQQPDDDDDSSDATRNDSSSIVIHCVQGKDRTGMLIMLMQLLIRLSDAEIIDDYYRSNDSLADYHTGRNKQQRQQKQTQQEGRQNKVVVVDTTLDEASASSAAAAAMIAVATSATTTTTATTTRVAPPRIKMEKHIFGGTNKAAMISTLEGLRHRSSTTTTTNDAAAAAADASTTANTSTRSSSSNSNSIPIHYFDSIGFHESWRTRFHNVFKIKVNDTTCSIVRQRRKAGCEQERMTGIEDNNNDMISSAGTVLTVYCIIQPSNVRDTCLYLSL